MKCSKCGYEAKEGQHFCMKCGNKLVDEMTQEVLSTEQEIDE